MTIVVAVEHPDGVHLGCDSAITADDALDASHDPKWWRRGEVLVAYAGDLRAVALARATHARQRAPREDLDAYAERLASRTRAMLRAERIASHELELMLVARGRVYTISAGVVLRSAYGYAAIGSGTDLALGSLASTEYSDPDTRVRLALEATVRHSSACAAPLHFECVR